ncbi:hypothetical protein EJ05DRAFT_522474 [Pseudovirgaria hyperparasitica]|uniref:SH3 and Ded_cyto domain protein n=1 Tax=Pseudovirgaria hyperparasitica TaxID=470096 RepID=A0A6A6WJ82_9PEZI|nr:uncharacterized protein EJ05DRAFT_522474 [Pseudovirgaria hyperparasitica]KAF2762200.1 hypothetical protein EJ05DRAFT_522474 [Pseudovirgaria hyperparasitica]
MPGWRPLPRIAFAICTYPFQPTSTADLPLEIGDELYIIELGGEDGSWYRGYLVAPPSLLAGLTTVKGQTLEARVFSGIFPKCCVEVREVLGDKRLTSRISQYHDPPATGALRFEHNTARADQSANGTCTPDEGHLEGTETRSRTSPHGSARQSTGMRLGSQTWTNNPDQMQQALIPLPPASPRPRDSSFQRPLAPVPMLKIGDENPTSIQEPLVDEIASCLREWHSTKLHELLLSRTYTELDKTSALVDRLDTARRQLLHKVLTQQELRDLRERTVWDLVRGNKLLSGDVIVRSPHERGRMLTAEDSAIEVTQLQSIMSLLEEQPTQPVDEHTLHHLFVHVKSAKINISDYSTQLNVYLCVKTPGSAPRPISEVYSIDLIVRDGTMVSSPTERLRALFADLTPVDFGEGAGAGSSLYLVVKVLEHEPFRDTATRNGSLSGPRESISSLHERPSQAGSFSAKGGRRSMMFGARKREQDSITSPEHQRTASHSRTSGDTRPGSRMNGTPSGKSAKRTVAVGVCRVDDIMKSKTEMDWDLSLWSSAGEFDEVAESDYQQSEIIPELFPNSSGRYKRLHAVNSLQIALNPFENPDAEALIEKTPTLMHNMNWTPKIGWSGAPRKARSDIYLTVSEPFLSRNSFLSHPKHGTVPLAQQTSLANLQLTIEVRRATGERIDNCIFPSSNSSGHTAWRTTAVEKGDKWNLTVRLAIKPEDVPGCHLVMSIADAPHFPFALCWMPLWQQDAFIRDGDHSLALYKYDEFTSGMISGRGAYLGLPWNSKQRKDESVTGAMASVKLSTFLCSTKYSQDPSLIGLLKWKEQSASDLAELLKRFAFVPEIEIVKLLPDVFDALFEIVVDYAGNDEYEDLVFNALVVMLSIVHDRRFNLGPLVDDYAEKRFNYPFATSCLLRSFTRLVDNPTNTDISRKLRATLKVGGHIFKFIMNARKQQKAKEAGIGITSREPTFTKDLQKILKSLGVLMTNSAPILVGTKTLVVQYFHTWIPEFYPTMTHHEVLQIVTDFTEKCADVQGKLILYKLVMVYNFLQSDVLKHEDIRPTLLQYTSKWLEPYWGFTNPVTDQWKEQVRLCSSIVASHVEELDSEVPEYMHKLVDSFMAIQKIPRFEKSSLSLLFPSSYPFPLRPTNAKFELEETLVEISAVLAALSSRPTIVSQDWPQTRVGDFLISCLQVHMAIMNGEAFPMSWMSTHIYHHKSTMRTLEKIAHILIESFLPEPDDADQFSTELWRSFFDTLLQLVGSNALALEAFPEQKRRAVWKIAGDVRELGANLLRRSWTAIGWETSPEDRREYNLARMGGYQVQYVPGLIPPIVELCLSVHEGLRRVAIDILHTMIISEWCLSQDLALIQAEMIDCLDRLFKSKPMTESMLQKTFIGELIDLFESLADSPDDDELFVAIKGIISTIDELLDLLVAVHSTDATGEVFHIMDTLHLMEFLKDMQKEDIYVAYVHQLARLQAEAGNYTEAGLALRLHADLYQWDPTVTIEACSAPDFPLQTAFERKEAIYFQMIKYYEDGQSWDNALGTYIELAYQYEHNMFDFAKLARSQRAMATIYEAISKGERPNARYFRVVYKGLGWPIGLRDKDYIFEGSSTDRLVSFTDRMQSQHPSAQILPIGSEQEDVEGQYLQVYAVTPQKDLVHPIYQRAKVSQPIRDYFLLSRPKNFTTASRRLGGESVREQIAEKTVYTTAETFPTILRRSEIVTTDIITLPPFETALERTTRKTSELYALEKRVTNGEDAAFTLLAESITSSIDTSTDASVALYRELLPQSHELVNDEGEERAFGVLENALRVALIDHALVIKRCLGVFSRGAYQATRAELTQRFEITFAPELEQLAPVAPPVMDINATEVTTSWLTRPIPITQKQTHDRVVTPDHPMLMTNGPSQSNGSPFALSEKRHKRNEKSRLSLTFLKRTSGENQAVTSAIQESEERAPRNSMREPRSPIRSHGASTQPSDSDLSRTLSTTAYSQRSASVDRDGSINHGAETIRSTNTDKSDGKTSRMGSVKKRLSALNLGVGKKLSKTNVRPEGTIRE